MYCNYMQLWVDLWGTGAVSSWEKLTNIWKPTRVGNFQARVWFLNWETIRKGENRVVQVLLCVGIPLSGQQRQMCFPPYNKCGQKFGCQKIC